MRLRALLIHVCLHYSAANQDSSIRYNSVGIQLEYHLSWAVNRHTTRRAIPVCGLAVSVCVWLRATVTHVSAALVELLWICNATSCITCPPQVDNKSNNWSLDFTGQCGSGRKYLRLLLVIFRGNDVTASPSQLSLLRRMRKLAKSWRKQTIDTRLMPETAVRYTCRTKQRLSSFYTSKNGSTTPTYHLF